jgi:hypothetical protein
VSETSLLMLSEAITDLAARVEALDAQVSDLGRDSAGELERRVRATERTLAEIQKTVSSRAQAKASNEVQAELRRPWHKLTAEQAEKRWLELRNWVEWLVVRDNIGSKEIPDCWYVHDGLVDELEALRWAWIACNKPDSKMNDPIAWRELLQRARLRWPSFNPNGCSTTHTETRPRVVQGEPAWRNFLAEELADRSADRADTTSLG